MPTHVMLKPLKQPQVRWEGGRLAASQLGEHMTAPEGPRWEVGQHQQPSPNLTSPGQAHNPKCQSSPPNKRASRRPTTSHQSGETKRNQQNRTRSFYSAVSFYRKTTKNINIKYLENTQNRSVIFFLSQTGADLFALSKSMDPVRVCLQTMHAQNRRVSLCAGGCATHLQVLEAHL